METSQNVWNDFMTHYSISSEELDGRTYSIDGHPQETLREIIVNNTEQTVEDIMDVEYVIPLKEIFDLKVGEHYISGYTEGNIVRLK